MARKDDYLRYEEFLEETKDAEGNRHRDEAVKLFTEELAADERRLLEFAGAHVEKIADGFDRSRSPGTDNGQMSLAMDNYLVLGEGKRRPVTEATAAATREWISILANNHARVAASWAAKTIHAGVLVKIQDERNCSMWEAEQIRLGE